MVGIYLSLLNPPHHLKEEVLLDLFRRFEVPFNLHRHRVNCLVHTNARRVRFDRMEVN